MVGTVFLAVDYCRSDFDSLNLRGVNPILARENAIFARKVSANRSATVACA
jgi:hypothetical protein